MSLGQQRRALRSCERKSSSCPLGASGVHLLVCLCVNYWTLVSGGKIKESFLDSDCPKVNTNQVSPNRRSKSPHLLLL